MSGHSSDGTERWWVVTNFETDPCCKAPNIATNGEKATCQTCGWLVDYDGLVRYRDTEEEQ